MKRNLSENDKEPARARCEAFCPGEPTKIKLSNTEKSPMNSSRQEDIPEGRNDQPSEETEAGPGEENMAVSYTTKTQIDVTFITPEPVAFDHLPLSFSQDVALITVVCLSQFLALAGLAQSIAPLRVIGQTFGTTDVGKMSWFPAAYSLKCRVLHFACWAMGRPIRTQTAICVWLCVVFSVEPCRRVFSLESQPGFIHRLPCTTGHWPGDTAAKWDRTPCEEISTGTKTRGYPFSLWRRCTGRVFCGCNVLRLVR